MGQIENDGVLCQQVDDVSLRTLIKPGSSAISRPRPACQSAARWL